MSQWLSAVWGLCWDELLPENLQENSMPTWEEILFRQSMPLKICQLTPGLSWSVSNYRTIKEIFCTMEPKASLGIQHLFVFRNPDTSKNACQAPSGPLPSAIKCMVFNITLQSANKHQQTCVRRMRNWTTPSLSSSLLFSVDNCNRPIKLTRPRFWGFPALLKTDECDEEQHAFELGHKKCEFFSATLSINIADVCEKRSQYNLQAHQRRSTKTSLAHEKVSKMPTSRSYFENKRPPRMSLMFTW